MRTALLLLLAACSTSQGDTDADTTPAPANSWPEGEWNPRMPEASESIASVRGLVHRRAVFHVHSPYSHDACDGEGYVDGVMDTSCEADLRAALCTDRYDAAFITDHPDYGDTQPFASLFHAHDGDEWVYDDAGKPYALNIPCEDGHIVQWRAGFEDDLMPVSLHDHVDPDPTTRHELLNASTADATAAIQAAGGYVFIAHTEQRALADLETLQDLGLHSIEAFNVHAMFSPEIRVSALGLDPTGWASDIGPFTMQGATGQPDLLFLAVHQEQPPSIANWDGLLQRGPMMATGGADSHQNVLPLMLSDGERVDSYRRGLRWFTTILQAKGTSAADIDEAVAARRAFVAFEALGTPTGLDVHLQAEDGAVYEMGANAPTGTLTVTCPTLADGSPHGSAAPEISVIVYKDGAPWQTECGSWQVDRGVYRVRVDIVPHHLEPFLGGSQTLIKSYPWVYSGAIRVAME
jgi:hypothetical protein